MTPTESAVLVGFLAFLGVVTAPIATSFMGQRQERKNARHDYIRSVVTALIDLRGDLQFSQYPGWKMLELEEKIEIVTLRETPEYQAMEEAYGKAYAIMISVDIKEIRDKAPIVTDNPNPSKKLEAIDFALKRLGEEYGLLKRDEF